MQAGLATRRLTFREVFVCATTSLLIAIDVMTVTVLSRPPTTPFLDVPLAA